jgi:hypothetical protein
MELTVSESDPAHVHVRDDARPEEVQGRPQAPRRSEHPIEIVPGAYGYDGQSGRGNIRAQDSVGHFVDGPVSTDHQDPAHPIAGQAGRHLFGMSRSLRNKEGAGDLPISESTLHCSPQTPSPSSAGRGVQDHRQRGLLSHDGCSRSTSTTPGERRGEPDGPSRRRPLLPFRNSGCPEEPHPGVG